MKNPQKQGIDLELLNAYLDGELDEAEMAHVRDHLKHDGKARALLGQYRRVDDLLREAYSEPVSDSQEALAPNLARGEEAG